MKLKEFRQAVSEGDVILKKLRAVTIFTAEATLTQAITAGRMGATEKLGLKAKEKVKDILDIIDAMQDEINYVEKQWRRFTVIDYVLHITGRSTIPDGFNDEEMKAWHEMRNNLLENTPGPDELEAL